MTTYGGRSIAGNYYEFDPYDGKQLDVKKEVKLAAPPPREWPTKEVHSNRRMHLANAGSYYDQNSPRNRTQGLRCSSNDLRSSPPTTFSNTSLYTFNNMSSSSSMHATSPPSPAYPSSAYTKYIEDTSLSYRWYRGPREAIEKKLRECEAAQEAERQAREKLNGAYLDSKNSRLQVYYHRKTSAQINPVIAQIPGSFTHELAEPSTPLRDADFRLEMLWLDFFGFIGRVIKLANLFPAIIVLFVITMLVGGVAAKDIPLDTTTSDSILSHLPQDEIKPSTLDTLTAALSAWILSSLPYYTILSNPPPLPLTADASLQNDITLPNSLFDAITTLTTPLLFPLTSLSNLALWLLTPVLYIIHCAWLLAFAIFWFVHASPWLMMIQIAFLTAFLIWLGLCLTGQPLLNASYALAWFISRVAVAVLQGIDDSLGQRFFTVRLPLFAQSFGLRTARFALDDALPAVPLVAYRSCLVVRFVVVETAGFVVDSGRQMVNSHFSHWLALCLWNHVCNIRFWALVGVGIACANSGVLWLEEYRGGRPVVSIASGQRSFNSVIV